MTRRVPGEKPGPAGGDARGVPRGERALRGAAGAERLGVPLLDRDILTGVAE